MNFYQIYSFFIDKLWINFLSSYYRVIQLLKFRIQATKSAIGRYFVFQVVF